MQIREEEKRYVTYWTGIRGGSHNKARKRRRDQQRRVAWKSRDYSIAKHLVPVVPPLTARSG